MKLNSLVALVLMVATPVLACAKKPKKAVDEAAPVKEEVKEAEPVITQECEDNASIFSESVKNKQFADAYEPWWQVYTTCPNYNKAVYSQGSQIVDYMYEHATDPAEKERLRKLIIDMQDQRIKYFGDDPKYPTAYILGEKALAYCDYYPEDELKEQAYPWLRASVEGMAERSKVAVLVKLVDVSYGLYKTNPDARGEQFMADYEMASNYLGAIAASGSKVAPQAAQSKDYVDNIFAISGAADCSKLDAIYAAAVEDNKENLDMLQKIAKLYKRVKCTESDVYFAACENANRLQPTEESAAGCARMATKKGDYAAALAYYKQALDLAALDAEDEDRPDYLYNMALICYSNTKDYVQARAYARQSLEANDAQGRCYILIGMCYAASKPYSASQYPAAKAAILNKSVNWAAVDKFVKAKQVDPSCAADADKLIAAYSKYFPTKEEMFDLPNEFGGATFVVGGWIGETTSCRAAR